MAIAFVNASSAGSTNAQNITTTAVDMTGATGFVGAISSITGVSAPVITDSGGLTWNPLTTRDGSITRVRMFWAMGTGSATHTFTAGNVASSFPSIAVIGFSGLDSSPFDVENFTNEEDGSTTIPAGSVTPNQNDSVLVTALGNLGTITSINTSYTLEENIASAGGQHFAIGLAYFIQGTAAAINPTWTLAPSNSSVVAAHAAFKPEAGNATPSPGSGVVTLTGTSNRLGFGINMPDEL